MSTQSVGGIDPGPRPGLVILHLEGGRLVRLERGEHLTWQRVVASSSHVALEAFVRGRQRTQDGAAQVLTASMVKDVSRACADASRVWTALPAGVVKPWADDERLRSYGITGGRGHVEATVYELTRGGGGHDRDAARHALRFAVTLGFLPKR